MDYTTTRFIGRNNTFGDSSDINAYLEKSKIENVMIQHRRPDGRIGYYYVKDNYVTSSLDKATSFTMYRFANVVSSRGSFSHRGHTNEFLLALNVNTQYPKIMTTTNTRQLYMNTRVTGSNDNGHYRMSHNNNGDIGHKYNDNNFYRVRIMDNGNLALADDSSDTSNIISVSDYVSDGVFTPLTYNENVIAETHILYLNGPELTNFSFAGKNDCNGTPFETETIEGEDKYNTCKEMCENELNCDYFSLKNNTCKMYKLDQCNTPVVSEGRDLYRIDIDFRKNKNLELLLSKNEVLKNSLTTTQGELDSTYDTLETVRGELTTVSTNLSNKTTDLRTKTGLLSTANTSLETIRGNLTLRNSQITSLESELSGAQTAISEKDAALTTANTSLLTKTGLLQTANEDLASTRLQLTNKQAELETEKGLLLTKSNELLEEREKLEEEREKLELAMGGFFSSTEHLEKAQQDLDSANKKLGEVNTEISTTKSNIDATNTQLESTKSEIVDANTNIKDANDKLTLFEGFLENIGDFMNYFDWF